MSVSELKSILFRELDKLGKDDLFALYAFLVKRLNQKKSDLKSGQRVVGSMKGMLVYMSDDFDAPLDDFQAYT